MPAQKKPDDRQFHVGDKIRVNLHDGKIEDAIVKAAIKDSDGTKLQVDVPALIDTRQVVRMKLPWGNVSAARAIRIN